MDLLNDKRRMVLTLLDQGKEVKNIDLGMYDLTPYYHESKDNSLVEMILDIKNDLRQLYHIKDKKVCFAPQQEEAFNFLNSFEKCILSAPTSFGKTMIVKELIYVRKPKCIIYIVPTNALAYELENSFKSNESFSIYSIFDRNKIGEAIESDDDFLLFVGTQEKYLEVKNSLPEKIDLFIIDEAYKLEESTANQRAFKLSTSFLDSVMGKSKKVILLSPNAKFIGFEQYGFKVHNSTYNAVDKNLHNIEENDFFDCLNEKASKNKTILYCDNPTLINDTIEKINTFVLDEQIAGFIKFLEREYHPDWSVIQLLKKGILVHHGQMPKYVQNKMIKLYNTKDQYKLLIGTNSISEGINTPTKNIFIHPYSHQVLSNKLLLKNTIGRAGRLGEYPIGHIYTTTDISSIIGDEIDIQLSISKDEELAEIEDSDNKNKIKEFCFENNIDVDFYNSIRKSTHYSMKVIRRVLNALKKDYQYVSIGNLVIMANEIFDDYVSINTDLICIRGVLQYSYINEEANEYISLKPFSNKIEYFKNQYKKKNKKDISNSIIIDKYMRFMYSSLEYYLYPIAKIAIELYEWNELWDFGNNIINSVNVFMDRYNKLIIGLDNYNQFTDEQKIILQALKDYGIIINNDTLNLEMIKEIDEHLKIRYSTFDIINTIRFLSENSNIKEKYLKIIKNYID